MSIFFNPEEEENSLDTFVYGSRNKSANGETDPLEVLANAGVLPGQPGQASILGPQKTKKLGQKLEIDEPTRQIARTAQTPNRVLTEAQAAALRERLQPRTVTPEERLSFESELPEWVSRAGFSARELPDGPGSRPIVNGSTTSIWGDERDSKVLDFSESSNNYRYQNEDGSISVLMKASLDITDLIEEDPVYKYLRQKDDKSFDSKSRTAELRSQGKNKKEIDEIISREYEDHNGLQLFKRSRQFLYSKYGANEGNINALINAENSWDTTENSDRIKALKDKLDKFNGVSVTIKKPELESDKKSYSELVSRLPKDWRTRYADEIKKDGIAKVLKKLLPNEWVQGGQYDKNADGTWGYKYNQKSIDSAVISLASGDKEKNLTTDSFILAKNLSAKLKEQGFSDISISSLQKIMSIGKDGSASITKAQLESILAPRLVQDKPYRPSATSSLGSGLVVKTDNTATGGTSNYHVSVQSDKAFYLLYAEKMLRGAGKPVTEESLLETARKFKEVYSKGLTKNTKSQVDREAATQENLRQSSGVNVAGYRFGKAVYDTAVNAANGVIKLGASLFGAKDGTDQDTFVSDESNIISFGRNYAGDGAGALNYTEDLVDMARKLGFKVSDVKAATSEDVAKRGQVGAEKKGSSAGKLLGYQIYEADGVTPVSGETMKMLRGLIYSEASSNNLPQEKSILTAKWNSDPTLSSTAFATIIGGVATPVRTLVNVYKGDDLSTASYKAYTDTKQEVLKAGGTDAFLTETVVGMAPAFIPYFGQAYIVASAAGSTWGRSDEDSRKIMGVTLGSLGLSRIGGKFLQRAASSEVQFAGQTVAKRPGLLPFGISDRAAGGTLLGVGAFGGGAANTYLNWDSFKDEDGNIMGFRVGLSFATDALMFAGTDLPQIMKAKNSKISLSGEFLRNTESGEKWGFFQHPTEGDTRLIKLNDEAWAKIQEEHTKLMEENPSIGALEPAEVTGLQIKAARALEDTYIKNTLRGFFGHDDPNSFIGEFKANFAADMLGGVTVSPTARFADPSTIILDGNVIRTYNVDETRNLPSVRMDAETYQVRRDALLAVFSDDLTHKSQVWGDSTSDSVVRSMMKRGLISMDGMGRIKLTDEGRKLHQSNEVRKAQDAEILLKSDSKERTSIRQEVEPIKNEQDTAKIIDFIMAKVFGDGEEGAPKSSKTNQDRQNVLETLRMIFANKNSGDSLEISKFLTSAFLNRTGAQSRFSLDSFSSLSEAKKKAILYAVESGALNIEGTTLVNGSFKSSFKGGDIDFGNTGVSLIERTLFEIGRRLKSDKPGEADKFVKQFLESSSFRDEQGNAFGGNKTVTDADVRKKAVEVFEKHTSDAEKTREASAKRGVDVDIEHEAKYGMFGVRFDEFYSKFNPPKPPKINIFSKITDENINQVSLRLPVELNGKTETGVEFRGIKVKQKDGSITVKYEVKDQDGNWKPASEEGKTIKASDIEDVFGLDGKTHKLISDVVSIDPNAELVVKSVSETADGKVTMEVKLRESDGKLTDLTLNGTSLISKLTVGNFTADVNFGVQKASRQFSPRGITKNDLADEYFNWVEPTEVTILPDEFVVKNSKGKTAHMVKVTNTDGWVSTDGSVRLTEESAREVIADNKWKIGQITEDGQAVLDGMRGFKEQADTFNVNLTPEELAKIQVLSLSNEKQVVNSRTLNRGYGVFHLSEDVSINYGSDGSGWGRRDAFNYVTAALPESFITDANGVETKVAGASTAAVNSRMWNAIIAVAESDNPNFNPAAIRGVHGFFINNDTALKISAFAELARTTEPTPELAKKLGVEQSEFEKFNRIAKISGMTDADLAKLGEFAQQAMEKGGVAAVRLDHEAMKVTTGRFNLNLQDFVYATLRHELVHDNLERVLRPILMDKQITPGDKSAYFGYNPEFQRQMSTLLDDEEIANFIGFLAKQNTNYGSMARAFILDNTKYYGLVHELLAHATSRAQLEYGFGIKTPEQIQSYEKTVLGVLKAIKSLNSEIDIVPTLKAYADPEISRLTEALQDANRLESLVRDGADIAGQPRRGIGEEDFGIAAKLRREVRDLFGPEAGARGLRVVERGSTKSQVDQQTRSRLLSADFAAMEDTDRNILFTPEEYNSNKKAHETQNGILKLTNGISIHLGVDRNFDPLGTPYGLADPNDPRTSVINRTMVAFLNDLEDPSGRNSMTDGTKFAQSRAIGAMQVNNLESYARTKASQLMDHTLRGTKLISDWGPKTINNAYSFLEKWSGKSFNELVLPRTFDDNLRYLTEKAPGVLIPYSPETPYDQTRVHIFHETTHRTITEIFGIDLADYLVLKDPVLNTDPDLLKFMARLNNLQDLVPGVPHPYSDLNAEEMFQEIFAHGTKLKTIKNFGLNPLKLSDVKEYATVYTKLLKAVANSHGPMTAEQIGRLADPKLYATIKQIYGDSYPQLEAIGSRRRNGFANDGTRLYSADNFPTDEPSQRALVRAAEDVKSRVEGFARLARSNERSGIRQRTVLINGLEPDSAEIPESIRGLINRSAMDSESLSTELFRESVFNKLNPLKEVAAVELAKLNKKTDTPAEFTVETGNKKIHYNRPYMGQVVEFTSGPDQGKIILQTADNTELRSMNGNEVASVQEGLNILNDATIAKTQGDLNRYTEALDWLKNDFELTEIFSPSQMPDRLLYSIDNVLNEREGNVAMMKGAFDETARHQEEVAQVFRLAPDVDRQILGVDYTLVNGLPIGKVGTRESYGKRDLPDIPEKIERHLKAEMVSAMRERMGSEEYNRRVADAIQRSLGVTNDYLARLEKDGWSDWSNASVSTPVRGPNKGITRITAKSRFPEKGPDFGYNKVHDTTWPNEAEAKAALKEAQLEEFTYAKNEDVRLLNWLKENPLEITHYYGSERFKGVEFNRPRTFEEATAGEALVPKNYDFTLEEKLANMKRVTKLTSADVELMRDGDTELQAWWDSIPKDPNDPRINTLYGPDYQSALMKYWQILESSGADKFDKARSINKPMTRQEYYEQAKKIGSFTPEQIEKQYPEFFKYVHPEHFKSLGFKLGSFMVDNVDLDVRYQMITRNTLMPMFSGHYQYLISPEGVNYIMNNKQLFHDVALAYAGYKVTPEAMGFETTFTRGSKERFDLHGETPLAVPQRKLLYSIDHTTDDGFYNPLNEFINSAKLPSVATAKDWLNIFTPKFKKDELIWTGIYDWLKDNPDAKLKLEEVRDFANRGRVTVGTMFLGTDAFGERTPQGYRAKWESTTKIGQFYQNYGEALFIVPNLRRGRTSNNFGESDLPSGYKAKNVGYGWAVMRKTGPGPEDWNTGPHTTIGDSKQEAITAFMEKFSPSFFYDMHWDDKNIVASLRFDEASSNGVDFDTLRIREVQSDLHQKGGSRGYYSDADYKTLETKIRESSEYWDKTINHFLSRPEFQQIADVGLNAEYFDKINEVVREWMRDVDDTNRQSRYDSMIDIIRKRFTSNETIIENFPEFVRWGNDLSKFYGDYKKSELAYRTMVEDMTSNEGDLYPQAPFSQNWHDVVFKRALRLAAERDLNYLAWTTGDTQIAKNASEFRAAGIERITIHKQVSYIEDPALRAEYEAVVNQYQFPNKTPQELQTLNQRMQDIVNKAYEAAKIKEENLKKSGGRAQEIVDRLSEISEIRKNSKKYGTTVEEWTALDKQYNDLLNENLELYRELSDLTKGNHILNLLETDKQNVVVRGWDKLGNVTLEQTMPLNGSKEHDFGRVRLDDLVGAELARKVREEGTYLTALEGENMTMGGGFFKRLYDEKMVNIANKIGKEYGVKAELADLVVDKDTGETVKFWRMPITDEIRKGVFKGQPLYSEDPTASLNPEVKLRSLPEYSELDAKLAQGRLDELASIAPKNMGKDSMTKMINEGFVFIFSPDRRELSVEENQARRNELETELGPKGINQAFLKGTGFWTEGDTQNSEVSYVFYGSDPQHFKYLTHLVNKYGQAGAVIAEKGRFRLYEFERGVDENGKEVILNSTYRETSEIAFGTEKGPQAGQELAAGVQPDGTYVETADGTLSFTMNFDWSKPASQGSLVSADDATIAYISKRAELADSKLLLPGELNQALKDEAIFDNTGTPIGKGVMVDNFMQPVGKVTKRNAEGKVIEWVPYEWLDELYPGFIKRDESGAIIPQRADKEQGRYTPNFGWFDFRSKLSTVSFPKETLSEIRQEMGIDQGSAANVYLPSSFGKIKPGAPEGTTIATGQKARTVTAVRFSEATVEDIGAPTVLATLRMQEHMRAINEQNGIKYPEKPVRPDNPTPEQQAKYDAEMVKFNAERDALVMTYGAQVLRRHLALNNGKINSPFYTAAIEDVMARHAKDFNVARTEVFDLLDGLVLAMTSGLTKVEMNHRYAYNILAQMVTYSREGKLYVPEILRTQGGTPVKGATGKASVKFGTASRHLQKLEMLTYGYERLLSENISDSDARAMGAVKASEILPDSPLSEQVTDAWYIKNTGLSKLIDSQGPVKGMIEYLLTPEGDDLVAHRLLGRKEGSFFANMVGLAELPTIDRHMNRFFKMIAGEAVSFTRENGRLTRLVDFSAGELSDKEYQRQAALVQRMATEISNETGMDISPREVQQILWDEMMSSLYEFQHTQMTSVSKGDTYSTAKDYFDTKRSKERFQLVDSNKDFEDLVAPFDDSARALTALTTGGYNKLGYRRYINGTVPHLFNLDTEAIQARQHVVNMSEPLLQQGDADAWIAVAERLVAGNKDPHTQGASRLAESEKLAIKTLADKGDLEGLQKYVLGLNRQSPLELLVNTGRVALLMGYKNIIKNIGGNSLRQFMDEISRIPATVLDTALIQVNRAIGGTNFDKSLTSMISNPAETLRAYATALGKGATEGTKSFMDVLRGDDESVIFEHPSLFRERTTGWKVLKPLEWIEKMGWRLQGAMDKPFNTVAFYRTLSELQSMRYKQEKKAGNDITYTEAENYLTPGDYQLAEEYALAATYQKKNVIADKYYNTIDGLPPTWRAIITNVVKFVKTPLNVADYVLDYTGIWQIAKLAHKEYNTTDWVDWKSSIKKVLDNPADRKTISMAISQGAIGTAMMHIGFKMAEAGLLSAFYSREEKKEEEQMQAKGTSFGKVNIGGYSVDISWLSPNSYWLMAGATMYQGSNDWELTKQDLEAKLAEAKDSNNQEKIQSIQEQLVKHNKKSPTDLIATRLIKNFALQTPFLRQANDIITAWNGSNLVETLGGQWITPESYVPAIIKEIAEAKDEYDRVIDDESFISKTTGKIQRNIPTIPGISTIGKKMEETGVFGVRTVGRILTGRESLPVKYDMFGRPVMAPEGKFGPLRGQPMNADLLTTEMDRFNLTITKPEGGTTVSLNELRKQKGERFTPSLQTVVNSEQYQSVPDPVKKKMLEYTLRGLTNEMNNDKRTDDEEKFNLNMMLNREKFKYEIQTTPENFYNSRTITDKNMLKLFVGAGLSDKVKMSDIIAYMKSKDLDKFLDDKFMYELMITDRRGKDETQINYQEFIADPQLYLIKWWASDQKFSESRNRVDARRAELLAQGKTKAEIEKIIRKEAARRGAQTRFKLKSFGSIEIE